MSRHKNTIIAATALGILGASALGANEIRVEIHTKTGGGCDGSTTTFDKNDG